MSIQMTREAITPTDQETQIARTSSEALAPLLQNNGTNEAHIRVCTEGNQETEITLPFSALRLLFTALKEMAKGHTVTLLPVDTELTTQQAAELMHVSRPYLIKLLESGKLPCRKLGSHRRIRYDDLLAYMEQERKARKEVLKELIAEQERLGLYE